MPTDLKISPDSNSSFALKAPLEMQELVDSFGRLILLRSKQDDGLNQNFWYVSENIRWHLVEKVFFWQKWDTLENEKMGPYLKASSQEEGFNREFKGLPLNVWQTPVSVGIWEKSI